MISPSFSLFLSCILVPWWLLSPIRLPCPTHRTSSLSPSPTSASSRAFFQLQSPCQERHLARAERRGLTCPRRASAWYPYTEAKARRGRVSRTRGLALQRPPPRPGGRWVGARQAWAGRRGVVVVSCRTSPGRGPAPPLRPSALSARLAGSRTSQWRPLATSTSPALAPLLAPSPGPMFDQPFSPSPSALPHAVSPSPVGPFQPSGCP